MNRKKKAALAAFLASNMLLAQSAFAAPAPDLPPADLDAGSQLEGFQQRMDDALAEEAVLTVEGDVGDTEKPELDLPDELKVMVNGYKVTGQDLFPEEDLIALIKDQTGKLLTFGDLQKQAETLTDYFRKRGYVAARVYLPAQKIYNGVIEYTVVVGRLGEVNVVNNTKIHDAIINTQIKFLKKGNYLMGRDLERAVWLLTDLAAAEAKATITPGQVAGTVDLTFDINKTDEKRGLLYADNYGSRYSGYGELGVRYDFVNTIREGDHFAVNGLHTNRRLFNMAARWTVPSRITDGLDYYVGYNQIGYEQTGEYRDWAPIGKAHVYSAGIEYAIRRSARNNLYVALGYELTRMRDEYRKVPALNVYSDQTADTGVASIYGNERDAYGSTVWRVDFRFGNVRFNNENTYLSNYGVNGRYYKLKGQILRRQELDPRLALYLSARAQIASSNLSSYERMSLGGPSGVRGFPTGEASGDIGYFARAELRWLLPVKPEDRSFHAIVYAEHGAVWIHKDTPMGDVNRRRLQGVGIGALYQRKDDWYIRLDYGWRLGAERVRNDHNRARGRFWVQGGVFF